MPCAACNAAGPVEPGTCDKHHTPIGAVVVWMEARRWADLRDQVRLGVSLSQGFNNEQRSRAMTYHGSCFCGAVKLEVSGSPEAMGYCHCRSCRSWSGGPVNAFSLWKPDSVRVTAGAEHIAAYRKTPLSLRKYCKKCGGHLMTIHPPLGLVDVFAATLPTLVFKPGLHVNYAETVLPMKDG